LLGSVAALAKREIKDRKAAKDERLTSQGTSWTRSESWQTSWRPPLVGQPAQASMKVHLCAAGRECLRRWATTQPPPPYREWHRHRWQQAEQRPLARGQWVLRLLEQVQRPQPRRALPPAQSQYGAGHGRHALPCKGFKALGRCRSSIGSLRLDGEARDVFTLCSSLDARQCLLLRVLVTHGEDPAARPAICRELSSLLLRRTHRCHLMLQVMSRPTTAMDLRRCLPALPASGNLQTCQFGVSSLLPSAERCHRFARRPHKSLASRCPMPIFSIVGELFPNLMVMLADSTDAVSACGE
jgi:hypothetical protein